MTKDEIAIYNRTIALLFNIRGLTQGWLLYLFAKDFDDEPDLRDRIFCILVCGLMDAVNDVDTRIHDLKVTAEKLGSRSCLYYLDVISLFIEHISDLLSIFSRDDMIVISNTRDEWVHGHLYSMHLPKRSVRYVREMKSVKEKMDSGTYNAIVRTRFETHGVGGSIRPLRARLCSYKTCLWPIHQNLSNPTVFSSIERDLALHSQFQRSSLTIEFPKPSDKNLYLESGLCLNLNDIAKIAAISPAEPDPIAPSRMP